MKVERESFARFAVAVALACYDLPADRAMTSDEAQAREVGHRHGTRPCCVWRAR